MASRHLTAAVGVVLGLVPLGLPTASAQAPAGALEVACDVVVRPGGDPVGAVRAAATGETICLRPGTYRISRPLEPRRDQTITGPGAVLDGSRVLRGFTRTRDGWVVRGQRQEGERTGTCLEERPECSRPDDVLRDGVPLRRVLARSDLGPGSYWFDYRHDAVHLGGDPRGTRIEGLVSPAAVLARPHATGVTVHGITAQHFATPAQRGAVRASAPGWRIEDVTVQDNHGAGITTEGGATVLDSTVRRNGQLGIGGTGDDTRVVGTVIARNGGGGYDPAWEAGGAKWAVTDGLRVLRNRVVRNAGPGLWTDIDAQDTVYRGNEVHDNAWMGIFHEISADAVIADNDVTGNGHGFPAWLWGSGILLAGSHDVQVTGNRLAGNAEGIGMIQQDRGTSDVDGTPRRLHDVRIADNTVAMAEGESGMVADDGRDEIFDDPTITWSGNRWSQRAPAPFMWDDEYLTLEQWRALGHDR